MKPSISPAATYSPDPQTRSIKDGRPQPTAYVRHHCGCPSYGARWDPEATPLRADRNHLLQGRESGIHRQRKLRHSACRYAGRRPGLAAPPLSTMIWVQRRTGGPEGYPPLSWPQGIPASAAFPRGHAATLRSLRRGSRGRGACCPIRASRHPGLSPWPYTLRSQGFPSRRV